MEKQQPDFYLTFVEVCSASGLSPELVREFQQFGLFPTQPALEPERYNPAEITRLQLIQRLREDLDINLAGIDVILRLRDRLQQLERSVNLMQHQLHSLEHQHFQRLYHDLLNE